MHACADSMLSGLVAAGNYRALVAARNNRTAQNEQKTCSPETLWMWFIAWLFLLLFFYYTQMSDSTAGIHLQSAY